MAVSSFQSARRLFRFGRFLLISGILDAVYSTLYILLIGSFYNVAELAFCSRADAAKQIPVGIVSGILSRVVSPVFPSTAHDVVKLRNAMQLLALRAMMLVNTRIMLGLLVVAEHALAGVFGAQWIAAAPVLRILCLDALLQSFHILKVSVLLARGHANLFPDWASSRRASVSCCWWQVGFME